MASAEKVQELDWNDESLEQQDGIRWFNVEASKPERFAVLSKKVTTAKTHYVKGQGYILCSGDDCPLCEAEKRWSESRSKEQRRKERPAIGKARTRYAVLIAWYNIGSDNKLQAGNPVDVGVMAFGGPGKIVQIREIAKEWGEDGDPRTVDMKAIISDKSKESFQEFQLQPQKKCLYREDPEVGKALKQKLKNLDFTLADIIAKERSDEEMEEMVVELLGEEVELAGTDTAVEDIDDVLSTPAKKAEKKAAKKQPKVPVDDLLEDDEEEPKPKAKKSAKKEEPEDDLDEEIEEEADDDMDAFGSILDAL